MKSVSKKITIFRKPEVSEFTKKNYKVLPYGRFNIGSAINPVSKIMSYTEEQSALMPIIIGVSSTSSEWNRVLFNYWNSLSIFIPENGKQLEIGFNYSLTHPDCVKFIKDLKGADGKPKTFSNDDDLADYVEKFIAEHEKWKYGRPINPADYMLWRYTLNYRKVANSLKEAENSTKIEFYIFDESEAKKIDDQNFEKRTKAGAIYYDLVRSADKVNDVLYYLQRGIELSGKTSIERAKILERVWQENPDLLLEAKNDPKLKEKAFIEECIAKGVLRRLPNSSMIVETDENTEVGTNLDDAIAFLNSEKNRAIKNSIEGRLRSLPVN